jgi:hypothetical protein
MKRSIVVLALLLSGCAAASVHPGAANTFDSGAYDKLIVAHSVIESTKTDLSNGAFKNATIELNVRVALRGLIKAYNIADTAYKVYHNAAIAGQATSQQEATLTDGLISVQASTTALTQTKAGK